MSGRLPLQSAKERRLPFGPKVQMVIAAVVLFWSGFFTMDFLVSGIYTWPRTSRMLVVTLAGIILSYEFIYKDHQARMLISSKAQQLKVVVYACLIPYMLGTLVLLTLFSLSHD